MTPLLLTASILAADLNKDGRIDGRDNAWCLAAWGEAAPAKQANILANWGTDWSDATLIVDVYGAKWAVYGHFVRRPSPLIEGKTRVTVGVYGIDEK